MFYHVEFWFPLSLAMLGGFCGPPMPFMHSAEAKASNSKVNTFGHYDVFGGHKQLTTL